MRDILSLLPQEIETWCTEKALPKYRAKQVWEWLHVRHATTFSDMNNIPKAMKVMLGEDFVIATVGERAKRVSKNDGTVKYLFELVDGNLIESVVMDYHHGRTICVSTQVGCRMGCKFCASAEGGLVRNLTPGEMCAQVYAAVGDKPIRGIVLMGCGEPLDNMAAVLTFLKIISHDQGLNIGMRHITLSTCGLVPEILALAAEKLQITLAISLHATTDEKRAALMPIANRYTLEALIEASRVYVAKTGRRVTFEYALVKGANDGVGDARALIKLLRGINCHVNLIPVNKGRGGHSPTGQKEVKAFADMLVKAGVQATVRRSLGQDVDGACGQLRANHM